MFNLIAKSHSRMASQLRRVLIVDPQPASSSALSAMLRDFGQPEIWIAPTSAKALKLADKVDPQVIFCELSAEKLDGTAFTRVLRRSNFACRKTPVVLVTAQATPAAILSGRDAGAHEFLRRPFNFKDLARRIEAVSHVRGWVEAVDYVGPDRRRFNSAAYEGPLKRLADQEAAPPHSVRIGECLKIIRSALTAVDRDPPQALRALLAQTTELDAAAAETADSRLAAATSELHSYLFETANAGAALNATEAARRAAGLLNYAGREARAA